ncbi:MAG: hypothetical protein KGJ90_00450 [Patescibacteria group bacterium]|nr:hypothetical protein [Patescibacteria group bacterium]
MIFIAKIKRHSTIDHEWRGHHRVSGILHGITFKLRGSLGGGTYETDSLGSEQVLILNTIDSIEIAGIAELTNLPEVSWDPPKELVCETVKKRGRPRKE